MRYGPEHNDATRERILDAASRLFPEHGIAAVGLADVLAAWLSSHRGHTVTRADAAALLGLLAGTLQLARATPDRAESDAILGAGVRAAIRLAR